MQLKSISSIREGKNIIKLNKSIIFQIIEKIITNLR